MFKKLVSWYYVIFRSKRKFEKEIKAKVTHRLIDTYEEFDKRGISHSKVDETRLINSLAEKYDLCVLVNKYNSIKNSRYIKVTKNFKDKISFLPKNKNPEILLVNSNLDKDIIMELSSKNYILIGFLD